MIQNPLPSLPEVAHLASAVVAEMGKVIEGKPEQLRIAVTVLLAEGHLLIEDVPGVGKTQLAAVMGSGLHHG